MASELPRESNADCETATIACSDEGRDDGGDWPSDADDGAGWGDDADLDADDEMMELPPLDLMPQLELLRQVSEEEHAAHLEHPGSDTANEEKDSEDLAPDEPFITPDGSKDLAWHQEVEALEAILGSEVVRVPDNSDELIQRLQGEVTITIRPYCGDLHLYEDVEIVCTFKQHKDYPDVPPRFSLSDEKGLSSAEVFVLTNVMEQHVRGLRDSRPGDPIIFDVVSHAQEFLAQKATFVTKKEFSKKAASAKRKAAEEKKAKERKKVLGQVSVESPTVTIDSWVSDSSVQKFLPSPAALATQLESASTNLTWNVRSVVSPFLVKRFQKAMKALQGAPTVAFHGTAQHNTASIAAHGLLVAGVQSKKGNKRIAIANGAAYGHGVYSSPAFSTAACYAGGSIFLCLVQLGKSNYGSKDWMGASTSSEFNSNVAGSIYVLFTAEQVLPCLLLSYKRKPGATSGGLGYTYSSGSTSNPNISQTIVSFVPAANSNRSTQNLKRSAYRHK